MTYKLLKEGFHTHIHLKVALEIVVYIYDTFDNKLGVKNDFTKYSKESLLEVSWLLFPFKYFPNYAFSW